MRGLTLIIALGAVTTSAPLRGQDPAAGALAGRVLDRRSIVVGGAIVSVDGDSATTSSSPDGRFFIGGLKPGVYSIVVRHVGHSPKRLDGVRVE